jgi:hypothetical protein
MFFKEEERKSQKPNKSSGLRFTALMKPKCCKEQIEKQVILNLFEQENIKMTKKEFLNAVSKYQYYALKCPNCPKCRNKLKFSDLEASMSHF